MLNVMAIVRVGATMLSLLVYLLGLLCMRKPETAWKVFKVVFVIAYTACLAAMFWLIWKGTWTF